MHRKIAKIKINRPDTIVVPAEYGTQPIFVPEPTSEPRRIVFPNGITWTIGVESLAGPQALCRRKGFDVRHAQVLFGLLAHHHTAPLREDKNKLNLTWRELARLCGMHFGQHQQNVIKEVLDDLRQTWTQVEYPNGDKTVFVTLLGYNGEIRNGKLRLGYAVFDNSFLKFLQHIEKYIGFRFDVWSEMTSRLAKSIYLYLPSRALHHSSQSPFRITLATLFHQLDIGVPIHKSVRHKYMTQHARPVIDQLNKAPVHGDKILRVKLEETENGKDYNLCAWIEQDEIGTEYFTLGCHPESKLLAWWQLGGRSIEEFKVRLRDRNHLNPYEKEKLTGAELNIAKDMPFLEMSKTLLGEATFSEICGELNMRFQSGGIKNPGSYLTAVIRKTLSCDAYQPLLQLT